MRLRGVTMINRSKWTAELWLGAYRLDLGTFPSARAAGTAMTLREAEYKRDPKRFCRVHKIPYAVTLRKRAGVDVPQFEPLTPEESRLQRAHELAKSLAGIRDDDITRSEHPKDDCSICGHSLTGTSWHADGCRAVHLVCEVPDWGKEWRRKNLAVLLLANPLGPGSIAT